jgi:hypothetical protein
MPIIAPPSGNTFHHSSESSPQVASSPSRVGLSTSSSIGAHPDRQQENPTASENSCCSRFFQSIGAWIVWIFTCGYCNCFPRAPSQQVEEIAPEDDSLDDMPPLEDDQGNIISGTPQSRDIPRDNLSLSEPEEVSKTCFSPSPTADFFDVDAYSYAMDKLMDALMERDKDAIISDHQAAENCSSAAYELISNLIKGQVMTVSSDVDTIIIQKALHLARLEQLKVMLIRNS